VVYEVPEGGGTTHSYPVAACATGRDSSGRRIVAWLSGPAAEAAFRAYGFHGAGPAPLSSASFVALLISLKVAFWATAVILRRGSCWAAPGSRGIPRQDVRRNARVAPVVLPPPPSGYLLLVLLARSGPLEMLFWASTRRPVYVEGGGAGFVSCLCLSWRTARVAFEEVDRRLEGVARTLGLGPVQTSSNHASAGAARPSRRAVLGFSRALGEFGATIIVGATFPARRRPWALAISATCRSATIGRPFPLSR